MKKSVWEKYSLSDVCLKIYSGGTPSTQKLEFWNGDYNWLSSGETSQIFIKSTERKITKEAIENSSTQLALKGSVVIATAGQGHTRGQVSLLNIDTYINQSLVALVPDPKILDNRYLFYNLQNRYNELRQLSDGTSIRGSLSGRIIKKLQIYLPSLEYQQKVSRFLETIDLKIELNKQINKNLEFYFS